MILRPRGSTFGVGFRRARSMRLCATCIYAGVNSVSRCRLHFCAVTLSPASACATPARCDCVPHASMLASTASRVAVLHFCAVTLSSASACATPARCDCVPHASLLASTASRAAGLHFCAVTGYLRRRLSPCPLDATVPHASMLASTASRNAVLHFCAASAYLRRRLCSVALLDRCGAKACCNAGVAHRLSRCSAIDLR